MLVLSGLSARPTMPDLIRSDAEARAARWTVVVQFELCRFRFELYRNVWTIERSRSAIISTRSR